eukprot:2256762-Prymnesium_polylepis.1
MVAVGSRTRSHVSTPNSRRWVGEDIGERELRKIRWLQEQMRQPGHTGNRARAQHRSGRSGLDGDVGWPDALAAGRWILQHIQHRRCLHLAEVGPWYTPLVCASPQ